MLTGAMMAKIHARCQCYAVILQQIETKALAVMGEPAGIGVDIESTLGVTGHREAQILHRG